jgi:MFS transporter, OFA family, oxalate/formate antiporter
MAENAEPKVGKKVKEFNAAKSNFGFRGWVVLIIVGLSVFLQSSIMNDSLNTVVMPFATLFNMDPSIFYILSTLSAWVAVIGAALWGHFATKNAKAVWAVALGLVAVTLVIWSQIKVFPLYIVVLVLAAIAGQGFNYIGNYSIVNNWWPRKKGLVMGWVTIGFPLSAMVTVPLTGGLLNAGGLQAVYIFYAVFALVLLALVLLVVKNYPEQAGKFADNDPTFSREQANTELAEGLAYAKTSEWSARKLLKTGKIWRIGFSFGVLGLLSLGIMTNFVPRAAELGFTQEQCIPMLAITGLVACFGSYLCGVLDAKVGPKKATVYTLYLAVAAVILNVIPTPGNITFFISLPLFGVMLGGAANYLVSIVTTMFGRYDFPNAYKVILPINTFVAAAGVSIVGGLGQGVSYTVAYIVVGVLALIASFVANGLDDRKIGR